jgi:diguanylate cyclase (GGDEF)-like protein
MAAPKDSRGERDESSTKIIVPDSRPRQPRGETSPSLVVLYSQDAADLGRRHDLDPRHGKYRVGRVVDCDIPLQGDAVSRWHASFEPREDGWWIADAGSTNGTYVNDERVTDHALRPGDLVKIGHTIFKFLDGDDIEGQFIRSIGYLMETDALTGARNRKFLDELLGQEFVRARRHDRPLSVVLLDIDHFKAINDTHGHLAGDAVLRELCTVVRNRVRRDEVLGRYGGEEFALVLPETPLEGAAALAEDLRKLLAAHRFTFEIVPIPVTVSFGVAVLAPGMTRVEELIAAADARLYEAKRSGRNRVAS